MKRYSIPILVAVLMLSSGLTVGCDIDVQTFSKHDMSFKVYDQEKLQEYTFSIEDQIFQKGSASYDEGAVVTSWNKGFIFLWVKVPNFTSQEARSALLRTQDTFESVKKPGAGPEGVKLTGSPYKQEVSGFDVTFAYLEYEYVKGGPGQGITAVWYCPASQRMMQLIMTVHPDKEPKEEMLRFIHGFSCE